MKRGGLAAVLVAPLLAAVIYALWSTGEQLPLPPAGEGRGEGRNDLTPPPAITTEPTNAPLIADAGARNAPLASSRSPEFVARAPTPVDSAPSPASGSVEVAAAVKAPPHPLDRDGIRGAIREKLPELQDCYDAWLQQNPELGGTLKLSFQINAADGGGVVQNIAIIDGGVGHFAFEGCVANVFDGLDFEPPSSGSMSVTYPLVFSSTDAP